MGTDLVEAAPVYRTKKMIMEQVVISPDEGQRQRLGSALASIVGPTQVQPGCSSCRLFQSWQDSDEFLIEVKWQAVDGLMSQLALGRLQAPSALNGTEPQSSCLAVLHGRGGSWSRTGTTSSRSFD
jgi:quinol monooxygenase YgiN